MGCVLGEGLRRLRGERGSDGLGVELFRTKEEEECRLGENDSKEKGKEEELTCRDESI